MQALTSQLHAPPAREAIDRPAGPELRYPWLMAAGMVLLLYAILGRGGAYIGVPPLFIGELLLAAGVASITAYGAWRYALLPLPLWLVLALCFWGALRTFPYVGEYGFDAFRDAVIWGYSAFALIVFYYIARWPRALRVVVRQYHIFATICIIGIPTAWGIRAVLGDATPEWPLTGQPMIDPKAGDVMVHLGGIFAYWISGLGPNVGWMRLILFCIPTAIIGAYERAGMFAFAAVFLLCLAFRPAHPVLKRMVLLGIIALGLLAASNIEFEVPSAHTNKVRLVSFQQFFANFIGVFGQADMGDLDDTKEWRLNWWKEIISYTFQGDYFWTGKGFGINLADDDGFQVNRDGSLRSPHNAHMVILGRSGVPGLTIWSVTLFVWAWTIFKALIGSIRDGSEKWAGLYLFLLAYFGAFMVNATFDVYLEGPMGGIWFWSMFGLGVAALWAQKHHPDLLEDDADSRST